LSKNRILYIRRCDSFIFEVATCFNTYPYLNVRQCFECENFNKNVNKFLVFKFAFAKKVCKF